MSNRVCRLIGIIIALLALTEAAASAGWKGAVIGQDMSGTVTVDAAGTTHMVALSAYKAFDLIYTTFSGRGVRGPILKSNVGLMRPQAMAIAVARVVGVGPMGIFYAGRIGNLFCWSLLVYFSLRLIPIMDWTFLLLALTPMSLAQAASLSADATVNAVCVVFVALVLPNLPGSLQLPPDLPQGIAKSVILLYVVEMLLTFDLKRLMPRLILGVMLIAIAGRAFIGTTA